MNITIRKIVGGYVVSDNTNLEDTRYFANSKELADYINQPTAKPEIQASDFLKAEAAKAQSYKCTAPPYPSNQDMTFTSHHFGNHYNCKRINDSQWLAKVESARADGFVGDGKPFNINSFLHGAIEQAKEIQRQARAMVDHDVKELREAETEFRKLVPAWNDPEVAKTEASQLNAYCKSIGVDIYESRDVEKVNSFYKAWKHYQAFKDEAAKTAPTGASISPEVRDITEFAIKCGYGGRLREFPDALCYMEDLAGKSAKAQDNLQDDGK